MPTLCPFADCNFIHVGLGVLSAFFPDTAVLNAVVFAGYETVRAKPFSGKVAAMGQWGLGYAIGSLLC